MAFHVHIYGKLIEFPIWRTIGRIRGVYETEGFGSDDDVGEFRSRVRALMEDADQCNDIELFRALLFMYGNNYIFDGKDDSNMYEVLWVEPPSRTHLKRALNHAFPRKPRKA